MNIGDNSLPKKLNLVSLDGPNPKNSMKTGHLDNKAIRHAVFLSVADLQASIEAFLTAYLIVADH